MASPAALAERATRAAAARGLDIPAPKVNTYNPPLQGGRWEHRSVDQLAHEVTPPQVVPGDATAMRRVLPYGDPRDTEAARRSAAVGARAYGPSVRIRALVVEHGQVRQALYVGQLSAVRQALPDEAERAALVRAGVTGYAVAGEEVEGVRPAYSVPWSEAPTLMQVELETRGLEAEVSAVVAMAASSAA